MDATAAPDVDEGPLASMQGPPKGPVLENSTPERSNGPDQPERTEGHNFQQIQSVAGPDQPPAPQFTDVPSESGQSKHDTFSEVPSAGGKGSKTLKERVVRSKPSQKARVNVQEAQSPHDSQVPIPAGNSLDIITRSDLPNREPTPANRQSVLPALQSVSRSFAGSCERIEDYLMGGYISLSIPCILRTRGKSFKILHKLGWGGSCTVWLARDQSENRYVAVKILKASWSEDRGRADAEVERYRRLRSAMSPEDADRFLVPIYEVFYVAKEGQRHCCVSMGLTGPSIDTLSSKASSMKVRPDIVRSLARQLVTAVAKIHSAGFVWADINAGNVALSLAARIHSWDEETLYARLGRPVGHRIAHDAPTIYEPLNLSKIGNPERYILPQIKCIDFGQSYFLSDGPGLWIERGMVSSFIDPEALWYDKNPDQASDVFAIGAIVYCLRSGERDIWERSTADEEQNELKAAHCAILGLLPNDWLNCQSGADNRRRFRLRAFRYGPADSTLDWFYAAPWMRRVDYRRLTLDATSRSALVRLSRRPRLMWRRTYWFILRLLRWCRNMRKGGLCVRRIVGTLSRRFLPCSCNCCWQLDRRHAMYDQPYHLSEEFASGQENLDIGPFYKPGPYNLRRRIRRIGRTEDYDEDWWTDDSDQWSTSESTTASTPPSGHSDPQGTGRDSTASGSANAASSATPLFPLPPPPGPLSQEEAADFETFLLATFTWYRRDRATPQQLLEQVAWLNLDIAYTDENDAAPGGHEKDAAKEEAAAGDNGRSQVEEQPWIQRCRVPVRLERIYSQMSEKEEMEWNESIISDASDWHYRRTD